MEDKVVHTNNKEQNTAEPRKLKHSHSVPVKRNKETFNPLLFRNSRSNINDARDDSDKEESKGLKQQLDVHCESKVWDITNIEEFPSHFEIQRTHCVLFDALPNDIAGRISDYLSEAADSVLFDNENAIAHVEIDDELRLLIRLFKSYEKDSSDENAKECVLVEVTRRHGCSAKFHFVANKILAAAQNIEDNTTDDKFTAKPLKVSSELRQEFLNQVRITPRDD